MGDIFFQIFLALLGIVVGILSQVVPRAQRSMLLIFSLLLFLSAGLWWGNNLATKESASTPVPTDKPFELAGVWEGSNPEGVVFRFTFASKCNVGDVCGKVELPTVGCTAIPVLVSTDGVTYEFDETSHQNCDPDTANDTIKVLGDGTLLFGSVGQPPTIILNRK